MLFSCVLLVDLRKLTRDEMRQAGYPDRESEMS